MSLRFHKLVYWISNLAKYLRVTPKHKKNIIQVYILKDHKLSAIKQVVVFMSLIQLVSKDITLYMQGSEFELRKKVTITYHTTHSYTH
jgi:hypothetical protein